MSPPASPTRSTPNQAPNPLSPIHLLSLLPSLLPSSTSPSLDSATDLLVSFIHAIHISLGFRLSSTLHNSDRVLARRWNAGGPDSYKLEYKHEQSSLTYLVRIGTLGERAMIDAMAVEVNKQLHCSDLQSEHLLASTYLPTDIHLSSTGTMILLICAYTRDPTSRTTSRTRSTSLFQPILPRTTHFPSRFRPIQPAKMLPMILSLPTRLC